MFVSEYIIYQLWGFVKRFGINVSGRATRSGRFMEAGGANDIKVYIGVNEDRLTNGAILPRSFIWEDGRRYAVDKVLSVCHTASFEAGGAGWRYTVRIRGMERFMFLEEENGIGRWFMERKS